ncbi:MAG: hypothetical protein KME13_12015 [Myxacorys californica WJT36-NPBG1]|nr:hypothetical protein [Myxacorys californica WJT36-NPBG1]
MPIPVNTVEMRRRIPSKPKILSGSVFTASTTSAGAAINFNSLNRLTHKLEDYTRSGLADTLALPNQ